MSNKAKGCLTIIAVIFVLGLIARSCGGGSSSSTSSYSGTTRTSSSYSTSTTPRPSVPTPAPTPSATMGERNALGKAQSYLKAMAFSRKGLIEQLEFEGFTTDEATYGVDHCGADWKEQAVKKAASYLKSMNFSKNGLIEQLEFEGFTHEQAVYGVEQNWD